MTTVPLPLTTSYKPIAIITVISLLVHGVGLAYFWTTPIFQFSSIPPQTISVQLATPSPSTEINSSKTSPANEVKNSPQNDYTPAQQSSVEQPNKPNLVTQTTQKVKAESIPIPKPTNTLNQPTPIKQIDTKESAKIDKTAHEPANATPSETTLTVKKEASLPPQNIAVPPYTAPLKTMKQTLSLELHKHVARKYPLIARKRGWQGKVKLGFFITPSGRIENIHVIDSSGYNVLDKSAIKSLRQVKRITSALPASGLDMDLTIKYQLQDR